MEVKSFTAKYEKRDARRAIVVVKLVSKGTWLRNSPDDNTVRYHFIREGGRWVIDDIGSTPDGNAYSVR